MADVALFGGSFDPPHLGHVCCALYALSLAPVEVVWVLPSAVHPYGKPLSDFHQRIDLCRMAFAPLARVVVRTDEVKNPSGRTWDLVDQLSQAHPEHRWWLIGGSDTEADLGNWYRGEELRERLRIIPVPRRGYDDDNPAALPGISSTDIRKRLAVDKSVAGLVPASVAARLQEWRWYRYDRPGDADAPPGRHDTIGG